MDKILIQGGERLKGAVRVSGAKNAALPVMAACILTEGWHHVKNIPRLKDTQTIKLIMSRMGVLFDEHDGVLSVNTRKIRDCQASYDLVKTMRASILLLGPLVARLRSVCIVMSGSQLQSLPLFMAQSSSWKTFTK